MKHKRNSLMLSLFAIAASLGGCGSPREPDSDIARPQKSAEAPTESQKQTQGDDDITYNTGDWPLFRGDAQSTGVARSNLPGDLAILWESPFKKNAFSATPIVVEFNQRRLIILGSDGGPVFALDLDTGQQVWEFTGPTGFVGSAGFYNGRIYIGDVDGVFYCLDMDGKEIWKFPAEASIDSSPNFFEDTVLFTSQDSFFYCLKMDSGELVWKHAAGDQLRSTPTIAGGRAFVAGCDSFLHVIDLKSGTEVGSVEILSPTGCTPAVLDNAIFFGTEQAGVYAIDWKEPKLLWNYNDKEASISVRGNAAVVPGHVVFGTSSRQLVSLNPIDGVTSWSKQLKSNVESSPVIVGERGFVGAKNGSLYEFLWADGTIIKEYEFNGGLSSSPVVAFGRLVIATDRGVVYCLGKRSRNAPTN